MADKNADLLKEIRETYDYYSRAWSDIRGAGREDMQCIVNGPWDPAERAARQPKVGPKRPCLSLDELSQYLNQAEGNIRQAKRGITVVPSGNGANDKTAELRQGIIRQVEYECNALEAYIGAYVSMLQRSYGAFRVRRKYQSEKTFNQVLEISPIRNPDSVLPDPEAKESDYSDMERCFILEPMRKADFKRKYPDAEVKDFTGEHQKEAPQWIKDEQVLTAEFWKVEKNTRKLLMLKTPVEIGVDPTSGQPITSDTVFLDELPQGSLLIKGIKKNELLKVPGETPVEILKQRESVDKHVKCYLTNGIEILKETDWTVEIETQDGRKRKCGRYIPIVFMTGKEVYYQKTESGAAERYIFSLVRLAREPFMLYCYARTCQAEALGQVPKTTFMGSAGQFEGFEQDWQELGRVPKSFLEVHRKTEEGGEQILELPVPIIWSPPLDKMEMIAEAARRAIQAAIGITGLSNGHPGQDTSARSGIALKTLAQQTYEGNYHFVDAYDSAVKLAGRIMDDLLDVTYETARDQGIRKGDDTHKVVRINDPGYVDPENPQAGQQGLFTDVGDHQVTVSTGPTMQSQREAVDTFIDSIAENQVVMQLALQNPQSTAAKLLAVAIKLKNLGPLGDQIADDISPQQQQQAIPQQVQAEMQGMQQKLEQATALVGHLQQELKEKTQMKTMEINSKERINHANNIKDLAVVAIQKQQEGAIAFLENQMEAITKKLDMLHESELAPGPDSGDQPPELGIHPEEIPPPPEPNGAGAGQPGGSA